MAVEEAVVAEVVEVVSKRLADPNYTQVAMGGFVERHPDVARYASLQADRLGGGEAVVHALFHAHVIAECLERARGKALGSVTFAQLDAVATDDRLAAFVRMEPALSDYVLSNVEEDAVRQLIALIGLALALAG